MLRPFHKVLIQQVPTKQWTKRNRTLEFDFSGDYEIEKGWECHTDIGYLEFPKNIVIKKGETFFQQRGVFNVILGGSGYVGEGYNIDPSGNANTNEPLLLKGDVIKLFHGYYWQNKQNESVKAEREVFSGYISQIHSEAPIKISIQDNFFLLKRTPINKNVFSGKLIDLCKHILEQVNNQFGKNGLYNHKRFIEYEEDTGVPIYEIGNIYPLLEFFDKPDDMTAGFTLGELVIGDGLSCSQVLSQIKNQFKLDSFFVGNKLQFGFPIYDEERANSKNFFEFQNNIFSSNLEYKNKDDVILSAIVSCKLIRLSGKTTRDGEKGTKIEKLSVLVFWDIPTQSFKYIEKEKNESFPSNEGERHEFQYSVAPFETMTAKKLADYGIEQLKQYFYTGFRGSFKTNGYPFVEWNDNVNIIHDVFADSNGQYKVKKVKISGGKNGIEQEIFLDYRQNIKMPSIDNAKKIFMI